MSKKRTRKRRPPNGKVAQTAKKQNYSPGGLDGGWYKPLTDEGIRRIHAASLDVLEQIGIEVQASECRDIFEAAGARIDAANNRVFIPRQMVADAIASAPSEVTLCGRDPKDDIVLGGKKVYMGTGGAAVKVLDMDTGLARESTLRDVADLAKLCDALNNIHFYLRPVVARDIPDHLLDLNTFYAALANTTMHVTGNSFTIESVHEIVEMASMMMGGNDKLRERPIISYTCCWTVSPLRYAAETVEVLTEIVRQDIPVFISSAPQAGATAPAALAGTLVQINAEELSGIVYTQLVRPGARVILGYVPSVSDL
ncbi:MAG: trimethylamine methyltransferase family protein, partial [Candidatus Promineifilaceae bacterium]